jgi:hypothetical protein
LYSATLVPELAGGAIQVLKSIPTAAAQRLLAESVLSMTNPSEIRELAALSLAQHFQKHGILLDKELVALLKQLWEAESDPAVQTALAVVVGNFQPNAALGARRLQSLAVPDRPAEN